MDVRSHLAFFDSTAAGAMRVLDSPEFSGCGRIVFALWNEFAHDLLALAGTSHRFALLRSGVPADDTSSPLDIVEVLAPGDALLANATSAEAVSALLSQQLDVDGVAILAPVTEHFGRNRPLFLISIPKGGTHLLYRLAESLGYPPGVVHNDNPLPGNWYCVEYSNSHTVARDFFVDTTRRSPFGNRHHPFPRTPTILIYPNPLDVLVSEANYYHRDGATVFAGYLRHLDFEQRLLRLVDDPLLGSIRDRINNFVPWLDCENVIPVSFEELIGDRGGGCDATRDRLIWSLQLKLHVPGSPDRIGAKLFDESSPTFHEGRIGAFREKMGEEAFRRFFSLDQDFMSATGYAEAGEPGPDRVISVSARAEEFRSRPLRTSGADFSDTPFAVDWDFLGHNIVRFDGLYYALDRSAGPIDLVDLRARHLLSDLPSSHDLRLLQSMLSRKVAAPLQRSRHAHPEPDTVIQMSPKKVISLLLPTRGRPKLAERFFESVLAESAHPEAVEIILYVDDDDSGSHHLDHPALKIHRIIGPRLNMGEYNSRCLKEASGDIVVLVNDDMMIRTRGWDDMLRALDSSYADGIYLAYGNDLFKGGKLCTFPILSRRSCEVLGDPYPSAYRGAFIDYHLFDVFQRLRQMGHDRIRYLEDVVFEHLHFRAGKAEMDATYTQRDRFGDDPVFVELTELRAIASARLKSAINGVMPAPLHDRSRKLDNTLSMSAITRTFLLDNALPFRWRFFLWYWFLGRYAASRGWLKPLVH
ncbi:hypothetical protein [Methyloversatilis sp.]|uniref:hypothetical protein n=1 Tax=Methyloversatilis sp. TaxID=2569862 RepID=UPI0035B428D0